MTKLRQQLIQELVLRGCSPKTQEAYVSAVLQLARYYRRSPDQVTDQELKDYLFYLAGTRKLSASSCNQANSALRFFQGLFDAGKLEFHGELAALVKPEEFMALVRQAAAPAWVVYARRPFAGPRQVLAYLSRYTHRVAISHRRLLWADEHNVTFTYKDYADGARPRTMTLGLIEFVRRFCLHVLPERFVKIRHYGLLGNRQRQQRLARARLLLGAEPAPAPPAEPRPTALEKAAAPAPACCPFCQKPALVLVGKVAPARSPPRLAAPDSS